MPDTKLPEPIAAAAPKETWLHPERASIVRSLELNAAESAELRLANEALTDHLTGLHDAQRSKYQRGDYRDAKADVDAISAAEQRVRINHGKLSRLGADRVRLQHRKVQIDEDTRRILFRVNDDIA